MKALAVMVTAGLGSWLLASLVIDSRLRLELLCGMIGPLAGVGGSWVLIERLHRRNPQAVSAAMIGAFAFKLVFFGAYVAVVLRGLSLRPVPFVVSFVSFFCGLYLMEAIYLQRLFK